MRRAVHDWLPGKSAGSAEVDGVRRAIASEGGMWMYVEDADGGQPGLSVFLHSSGQDAFDTIKWDADELVDALLPVDPAVKVRWIKHGHHRRRHRGNAR